MKKFILTFFVLSLFACGKKDTTTPTPTPTKSSEKKISSFVISSLTPNVTASIDETNKTITAIVPVGTDVSQLTPNIVLSDKATVAPKFGVIQDFTKTVAYIVTAEDGSFQGYSVNIQAQPIFTLYNAVSGVAVIVDSKTFATIATLPIGNGLTNIFPIGVSQVLLYNSTTGKAMIVDKKTFETVKTVTIETGLKNGLYIGNNTILFLTIGGESLFLESNNLTTLKKGVVVPMTHQVLAGENKEKTLLYTSNVGDLVFIDNKTLDGGYLRNVLKDWTSLVNLDNSVLFYNATTGAAMTLSTASPYSKSKDLTFSKDWSSIVNIGFNQVLYYNAKTGDNQVTDNQNFAKIPATLPASAGGNWTYIARL